MNATATQTRQRIEAAAVRDLPPGSSKIVTADRRRIGVFNVHGTFRAVLNVCPHEGAPVCQGPVRGTTRPSMPGEYCWHREGEILACPWHGWEFGLHDGKSVHDPQRCRLKTFETLVEDGVLYVLL